VYSILICQVGKHRVPKKVYVLLSGFCVEKKKKGSGFGSKGFDLAGVCETRTKICGSGARESAAPTISRSSYARSQIWPLQRFLYCSGTVEGEKRGRSFVLTIYIALLTTMAYIISSHHYSNSIAKAITWKRKHARTRCHYLVDR
jgi:hypothetical protein